MYTQGWCDSINKGQVETDYGIQRFTMDQEYGTASILQSEVLEHEKNVFDEIALPEMFLEEYYAQVRDSSHSDLYTSAPKVTKMIYMYSSKLKVLTGAAIVS